MNTDLFEILFAAMILLAGSAIIAPLAAGKRKAAGWINFIMVSVACCLLLYLSYCRIFASGGESQTLIYIEKMKIYLLIDGLSALFIAIIAFMAIMSAFYSIEYMEHYPEYGLRGYYFNFPVFILGMTGIAVVDDLSTGFTIAWQLMTVSSFFLIRFEHRKKENTKSAGKYLLLMELAWLFILAGTFLVEGAAYGDPLHAISEKMASLSGNTVSIVIILLLAGFAFKAGVFPLGQLWLPDAHSIAPSPVSALLSGVMIKTGIYGIIRTLFWMMPAGYAEDTGLFWGAVVASFGVVTLFIGTVQSMKQSDAKRLLAYSSIGQIGYIVLGTGASLFMLHCESAGMKILSAIAVTGAIYHVINHAVFKGLLFLSSGSVLYATGTKDLNRLGGLLALMPFTAAAAAIASLSISGVPLFSGFASKWTIISSSLLAGSDILFLALFGIIALFTSAITLSCYVKFFGMTFTSSGTEWNVKKRIQEVPWKMIAPKVILSLLCIVQGLIPFFYYGIIFKIFRHSAGSSIYPVFAGTEIQNHVFNSAMGVKVILPGMSGITSSAAVPLMILPLFILAFIFAWLLKKSGARDERESVPWLCGYQELNNKNRYRDSSMFSVFKDMFAWTGGNPKPDKNL